MAAFVMRQKWVSRGSPSALMSDGATMMGFKAWFLFGEMIETASRASPRLDDPARRSTALVGLSQQRAEVLRVLLAILHGDPPYPDLWARHHVLINFNATSGLEVLCNNSTYDAESI